jgi:hypothetical protein
VNGSKPAEALSTNVELFAAHVQSMRGMPIAPASNCLALTANHCQFTLLAAVVTAKHNALNVAVPFDHQGRQFFNEGCHDSDNPHRKYRTCLRT